MLFEQVIYSLKHDGLKETFKKSRLFLHRKLKTLLPNKKKRHLNMQNVFTHYHPSEEYTEYRVNKPVDSIVKILAFYLPQFHPFTENDEFWGKGFTEWSNVTKAIPNMVGHYQPHLPIHLGFYDLRIIDNIKEQVKLANNYGVHGFCFYYYWFSGKKIMDTPLELLYTNKDIDTQYCLCWANENWTRTWDGKQNNILLAQQYLPDDPIHFFNDVSKYFKDERYIKINDKPVIIVYNASLIKDFDQYIQIWRTAALKYGLKGIYIVCANTFNYTKPIHDIDAIVEFPPHQHTCPIINSEHHFINHDFKGLVYDYNTYTDMAKEAKPYYKIFKSVMLSWDNTARKQNNSVIFHNFSVKRFKLFLKQRLFNNLNDNKLASNEKFVFINAWNEWAEGTHLEPDRKNGFAYLDAVYSNIKVFNQSFAKYLLPRFQKKQGFAILFHLYYTNTLDTFYNKSKKFFGIADFYFTIADDIVTPELIEKIETTFPNAQIFICENRGRDILPFIEFYKKIKSLNYKYICKTHSKQSLHGIHGQEWLAELLDSLFSINPLRIQSAINNKAGYLIPKKFRLNLHDQWKGASCLKGNEKNIKLLADLLNIKLHYKCSFAAGTMFWFDPNALAGLEEIENHLFSYENGEINGALTHAVERILGLLVERNNYCIETIES